MKRRELLSHLKDHGCEFRRQGSNHEIWWNPATGVRAPVPRHTEIKDTTTREICKQLEIPPP